MPRHLAKHDLGVSVMVFGGVWIQESEYREPPLVQGSPTAHQRHEGIKGQGGKGHCPFGGGVVRNVRETPEKRDFTWTRRVLISVTEQSYVGKDRVCARLATVWWAISSLGVSIPF